MLNGISFLNFKNITPLKFTKMTNPLSFKGLERDVFEKSEDYEFEKFKTWAFENDFLEKLQEILDNKENEIGRGFSNTVYLIPDNDDYVIRFSNKLNFIDNYFKKPLKDFEIKNIENKKLKGNFGQCVAYIKSPELMDFRGYEILKKQKGKSLGVPPFVVYGDTSCMSYEEEKRIDEERKIKYANDLFEISKFPQKSFDKLIKDLMYIQSCGYQFDFNNSNNFLYDKENKEFNLIDLEHRGTIFNNELGNDIMALLGAGLYMKPDLKFDNLPDGARNVDENFKIVFDKCMKALKNNGVKMDSRNFNFHEFLLSCKSDMLFGLRNISEKMKKLEDMGVLDINFDGII